MFEQRTVGLNMQLNTYFPDGLSGAPYFSHIYQNVNWLNRCVKAGQILLDRTSVNSLLVSMWYWYFVTDNVSFHVKCLGLYILYWYCCNWQLSSNLWLLSTCMPMLRTVWISVFLFGQEYEIENGAAAASHSVWSRSQSFACDWVDAASHIF